MLSKSTVEQDLKKQIESVVTEIGGIEKYVKKGEVVMIKPNFNTADPPPASTDIEFLKAVVELVYEAGAKSVLIGESSTFSASTKKIFEEKGVLELLNMPVPPKVYNLDEREWVKREVPGAKYLKTVSTPALLDTVDKLILLPCMKTHFLAKFTGSLKISVGLMKSSQRVKLHLRKLQEKIAELNKVINPDLIIMDGRKCFITGGPSKGEMREPGVILASDSRIEIDVEAIKIIQSFEGNSLEGLDPNELTQIKLAKEIGIK